MKNNWFFGVLLCTVGLCAPSILLANMGFPPPRGVALKKEILTIELNPEEGKVSGDFGYGYIYSFTPSLKPSSPPEFSLPVYYPTGTKNPAAPSVKVDGKDVEMKAGEQPNYLKDEEKSRSQPIYQARGHEVVWWNCKPQYNRNPGIHVGPFAFTIRVDYRQETFRNSTEGPPMFVYVPIIPQQQDGVEKEEANIGGDDGLLLITLKPEAGYALEVESYPEAFVTRAGDDILVKPMHMKPLIVSIHEKGKAPAQNAAVQQTAE